ncbi:MAG TPA: phosphohistidine phosphatase SixA [Casimicrobiaceae bacterium]|nr:phosphohistidine phosphatase SixA [Casimicrobiaceae bacterium]
MDLILWRHAEAEPGEPDLGRRLTAKGIKQAERVAAWLDGHLPDTTRILVSPADRAQQTALTLKRKFRVVPELAPGATARDVLHAAGWPDAREPVLIVGHQPTLGEAAASVLAGEERPWSVRKAAVWWLSNRVRDGAAGVVLKVVVGPDFV